MSSDLSPFAAASEVQIPAAVVATWIKPTIATCTDSVNAP